MSSRTPFWSHKQRANHSTWRRRSLHSDLTWYDPAEMWTYNFLRTKHFHEISSASPHTYSLQSRYGKVRLLFYDGQGYWLCMKRLSQGRFTWWPQTADTRVPLSARELIIVLWNGDPERAHMAADWRRVA